MKYNIKEQELLDVFAMHALHGIIIAKAVSPFKATSDQIVAKAYSVAESMIEERRKRLAETK